MAGTALEAAGFRPNRPIVLIGPMAVGKTAIGQLLARELGVEFVDTDQLVVHKHGAIADIFASRGERFFRQVEAQTVAAALAARANKPFVLSLGGGAVLDSGTQQLLAGTTVVELEADLDTVRERIARNSGRPLLQGDPLEKWSELAATRLPVYRRLARLRLDVRRGSLESLVQRLIQLLAADDAASITAVSRQRRDTQIATKTAGRPTAIPPGAVPPPSGHAQQTQQVLTNGTM